MRLILKRVACSNVYLSDPLIREYVKQTKGFVANAVKSGAVSTDNSPAEELPYKDNYFDLVVMINVLDHVMDAEKVMDSCCRITKKGGLFVFGQDLKDEKDVQKKHSDLDDILHPIKFSHL
ncbi:MAG: class I SAM-dependent methyltransferase, partial [Candidatus Omnitrophica bacterium]|nr:class I SAM-dependent methyltransferase [Candidatus Omnitrophota bacterium]